MGLRDKRKTLLTYIHENVSISYEWNLGLLYAKYMYKQSRKSVMAQRDNKLPKPDTPQKCI
jgi:hypothetical protein